MKFKVIKNFKDKYTKEVYEVNTILELSKERANEILNVGELIKLVREPKKKQK